MTLPVLQLTRVSNNIKKNASKRFTNCNELKIRLLHSQNNTCTLVLSLLTLFFVFFQTLNFLSYLGVRPMNKGPQSPG